MDYMNISLLELLNNSFVISINNTLYSQFRYEFERVGIDPDLIKLYKGVILKNGVFTKVGLIKSKNIINCTLSHIGIVSLAKSLQLPFVCIFEDDAIPCNNIIVQIKYFLTDIPKDCNMLKLGWCKAKPYKFNDDKFQIKNTYGSHAYIIFLKYYDKYLDIIYSDMIPDCSCMNYINTYTTREPLFILKQITNNTCIHGVDYTELNKSFDMSYIKENFKI